MIKSYRDLRGYQMSYDLGKEVHQVTHQFPEHERYELGRQLRRAALSIPLNIAEGYGKKVSSADFKRFILMALGSCNEVQVIIEFAKDFDYIRLITFVMNSLISYGKNTSSWANNYQHFIRSGSKLSCLTSDFSPLVW